MKRGYRNPQVSAVAVLIGTAVGAGVFGIPYVFAQAGALIGSVHIIVIGAVVTLTLLAYAQVVTRVPRTHQFPGYAKLYLGRTGQWLAVGSVIFGLYAALVAYMIEVGHFLAELLGPWFGGSELLYGLLFWSVASAIVTTGLALIARVEEFIVACLCLGIAVLAIWLVPHLSLPNLTTVNPRQALVPYGVILFAFGAASIIPEMRRLLSRTRQLAALPRTVLIGMTITGVLYLSFALLVLGVSGPATTESAIDGLAALLGNHVQVIGGLLAIAAMGSSFLVMSLALKQMYHYDFGISRSYAVLLTALPPLVIYLSQLVGFIQVMSIAGAVTGGFQGILIWEMYLRAQGDTQSPAFRFVVPVWLVRVFEVAYLVGVVYAVLYTVSQFL